jgi:hypothetical protein
VGSLPSRVLLALMLAGQIKTQGGGADAAGVAMSRIMISRMELLGRIVSRSRALAGCRHYCRRDLSPQSMVMNDHWS